MNLPAVPAPLVGGVLIGSAAATYLLLTGRVLGVSGAIKGLINGDRAAWRWAFLLGIVLPVPALAMLMPGSAVPVKATAVRMLGSGLLVGLGASLGNGCTSGHGVCGNARLSPRSMAFSATFMVLGAVSVRLFESVRALNVPLVWGGIPEATPDQLTLAAALVFVCLGLLAMSSLHSESADSHGPSQFVQLAATATATAVFSVGLNISGMTNPANVVSFLAFGTSDWNPSLMLVLMGAIAVAMLPFQWVTRRLRQAAPNKQMPSTPGPSSESSSQTTCVPLLSNSYNLPTNTSAIDARLLSGAALFGLGWGLSGICPGPALINAVAPNAGVGVWVYLLGMIAGIAAEPAVTEAVSGIANKFKA